MRKASDPDPAINTSENQLLPEDSTDENTTRKSLGYKGEISNIDLIYNHVIEEGNKVQESLKN